MIHTFELSAALPLGCFSFPPVALCSGVMTPRYSPCFVRQAYPIDPLLENAPNKAIQDRGVSLLYSLIIILRTIRIFIHLQNFRKLHFLNYFTPYRMSQPAALTHFCHTFLSHSVAREMRRCRGRWKFNKLWWDKYTMHAGSTRNRSHPFFSSSDFNYITAVKQQDVFWR